MAILARHGATVERLLGNELMALFGVPSVREDDALRAVRAAVELREAAGSGKDRDPRGELELRIGISTGTVVATGPAAGASVTGEVVSAGKRLEQSAGPGEIMLGPETQALVGHAVRSSAVELARAPGRGRRKLAYRLDSVDATAGARARRDDSPLVGREPRARAPRRASTRP